MRGQSPILSPAMASVDSPGSGAKQQQQQQRRWSVGRSSTPRSHFSRHSSEAFYASAEPLSGRGGRALHNASGGSGPDPDSNSVLDSGGASEARTRQYRISAARSSQADAKDRRVNAANDSELYYTVPRSLTISRKEILRRRSVRDDPEVFHSADKDQRPRTLPSIGKRARQDAERSSSGLKKVSRQDILRRRASVEESLQSKKDVGRSSSSFQNSSRTAKDNRDSFRPSTLPKVLHSSRNARQLEEYAYSRTKETAVEGKGREAPIYGRIRRRKMSLPTGATTLRDSTAPSSILTRYPRTKTNGESRAETSTKAVRHLRDPVPDPPNRSRYADDVTDDIYAKVARKVSKQVQSPTEKLEAIDRTVSRQRIISNADYMDSLERRMHQDRDQDVVKIKHHAILVSKADIERMRNYKVGRSDVENAKTSRRVDTTSSMKRDSKTDSWSRNKYPRRDSTWTNEKQIKYRSKSQSGLAVEEQRDNSKAAVKSMTLPSYVKLRRKTSTELPVQNADEQRKASNGGTLTKQSKERSNYVRKTATRASTHVRAFSDANSTHSNSPDMPLSIFGFCTGKRKTQASSMARNFPSWNLKTV